MDDEKLPEYVEVALAAAVTAVDAACRKALGITETYTARDRIDELRLAIHRFAREREAAVMGREAKLPDLYWPHIVTPCACCRDLRQQWKALSGHGK